MHVYEVVDKIEVPYDVLVQVNHVGIHADDGRVSVRQLPDRGDREPVRSA